jgi:hypothetical protein
LLSLPFGKHIVSGRTTRWQGAAGFPFAIKGYKNRRPECSLGGAFILCEAFWTAKIGQNSILTDRRSIWYNASIRQKE